MNVKHVLDRSVGGAWLRLLAPFSKPASAPVNPKKILIIKLAAVGDTILLVPVLRAFRKAHPRATVHWLVSPINQAIARTVPYVDRVIVWSGGIRTLPALVRSLRAEKYDVVFDVEQWARGSALLSFLSGAPERIGFDTPGERRTGVYTRTFPKKFDAHEIDDFFGLLSLLKPLDVDRRLELFVADADRAEVKERMGKFNVLIHPGCGADGLPREWPLVDYAIIGHWLIKKYGATLFLSSGPEEAFKTKQLRKLLKGAAVDLGGRLSWPGLVAFVDRMDLVLSGNTGVMHVAAALSKRQVALHGPTDPKIWGPINPRAEIIQSSCPLCPCLKLGFEYHAKDQSCMKKIESDAVRAAISRLIDNEQGI